MLHACQNVNVKACQQCQQHTITHLPCSVYEHGRLSFCFKTLNGFKQSHFAYWNKYMRFKSMFFHRQITLKRKKIFFRRLCLIFHKKGVWMQVKGKMSRKIKEITKLHPTEMTRWGLHSVAVFTNGEHIFFTNASTAGSSYSFKGTVRPDWICMRVVSLKSHLKGHQPLYVFNFLFLILNF